MENPDLRLIESAALPYLLSLPPGDSREKRPVLCFLHGLDEGPPTALRTGVTRHGPLRSGSSPAATRDFVVVAPQLPARGDLWRYHADDVLNIVRQVQSGHGGDPQRTYLSGFSFGGNGVFDLALQEPSAWAALWPVDPTRVPASDPGLPVWLSAGAAARYGGRRFAEKLRLQPPGTAGAADRVYVDEGLDHVGTAASAYRDERIYAWLLAWHR